MKFLFSRRDAEGQRPGDINISKYNIIYLCYFFAFIMGILHEKSVKNNFDGASEASPQARTEGPSVLENSDKVGSLDVLQKCRIYCKISYIIYHILDFIL